MAALIGFAIFWVVCGYYAAGYYYAFFMREYPLQAGLYRKDHVYSALIIGSFGSAALLATYFFKSVDGKRLNCHGRLYPWQEAEERKGA